MRLTNSIHAMNFQKCVLGGKIEFRFVVLPVQYAVQVLLPELARHSVRPAPKENSRLWGAPIAQLAKQVSMRQLKVRSARFAPRVRCQILTRVRASYAKVELMLQ